MTDEDRKKLIEDLRESAPNWTVSGQQVQQACDEIDQLYADKLNAEYQRDTALAELKDANARLEGLAERVKQYYDKGGQLEAEIEALKQRSIPSPTR